MSLICDSQCCGQSPKQTVLGGQRGLFLSSTPSGSSVKPIQNIFTDQKPAFQRLPQQMPKESKINMELFPRKYTINLTSYESLPVNKEMKAPGLI